MKTLLQILRDTEGYLRRHGVSNARMESEWLLLKSLGLSRRLDLYLQFERPMAESDLACLRPLLRRRAGGEPLQYVLGSAPFHEIEVAVGPGVFIPRPETESLVEAACQRYPGEAAVLDLCTGSAAVLLALAAALPSAPALAGVEKEAAAYRWAERNVAAAGDVRVELFHGDLFAPVSGRRFSLITANPPYVTVAEYAQLAGEVRDCEPGTALLAGKDGLEVIRRLVAEAPAFLVGGGWLLCEIGERQGQAVVALVERGWEAVEILPDAAGRDRILVARRPA